MTEQLAVWLYGKKVAIVAEERRRLRLTYTQEALESFAFGSPLLSLKLPLTSDRYPNGVVRSFLDGLLPEGESRRAIAADFNLRAADTFGLIEALGRDCAGAIVIQPDDDPPPPPPTTLTAEPLTDDALAELVSNLRIAPLGVDQRVRISLAGVQEKLPLTELPKGGWGRPVDGTPSTHILKPELRNYPDTVENELYCMRVAKHLGLPVANVEMTTVAGRKFIVVFRYDRLVHSTGAVERIHQEDLCQATGVPPLKKYEEDGGPSLRDVAETLRTTSPESIDVFLRATTLNVILGNGDAHAKNFSLIHTTAQQLQLAPLYDVLSTLHYGENRLAMYIDSVQRTDRVTSDRIINEAASWGMSRSHASDVVADIIDRVPAALERSAIEIPNVPQKLQQLVKRQLERLVRR